MKRKSKTRTPSSPAHAVRVIVTRRQIARRVKELAAQIAHMYDGQEVTIVAVLTGAVIFLADLIRRLPSRIRVEVAQVRSYPGSSTSSQALQVTLPLTGSLAGRHVLILDDILDTGRTLSAIVARVRQMKPASLRTCILLRKKLPGRRRLPRLDLVGFEVPDDFVVGYGLDFDNLYRNLPDICILRFPAGGERTAP